MELSLLPSLSRRDEVEDSTTATVTTFSIKVYYSIEAGEQTGRNIDDMVDIMFDNMNQRLDDMGTLTRATLHCLELSPSKMVHISFWYGVQILW